MKGFDIMCYQEELMNKLLELRPDLDKKVVVKEIQKLVETSSAPTHYYLKYCIHLAIHDITSRMPWEV